MELKAEYPAFGLREIARNLPGRFVARSVTTPSSASWPASPAHPPAAALPPLPRDRRSGAAAQGGRDLYLDGWSARRSLATSRPRGRGSTTSCDAGRAEEWPGLADRSRAPQNPAHKVDLRAMAAVRRLQANPELGEFRIHAASQAHGYPSQSPHLRPHLALHRALGRAAPRRFGAARAAAMPFAAQRRHQYWSVDVRYVEDHRARTGKPAYVISVLENFSRAFLASAISPRRT